jgi:hypothetical protein
MEDPLNKRYRLSSLPPETVLGKGVTYQKMSESPTKIENWTKLMVDENESGSCKILSLSSVDNFYAEKALVFKWKPDLKLIATEKCEGRNRVSFRHVPGERTEIALSYYGNVMISKMVRVTNVTAAKEKKPFLMKTTVESELEEWILLDDTYDEEEKVVGYEGNQLENKHLQYIMEEEMERILDDNNFVFSDDGKSFHMLCDKCENVPCLWEENKESMVQYDKAMCDEDAEANKHRYCLYKQMALVINGGPAGRGNRLKLPECVVTGVRELFPDPGAYYVGHQELE